jgi:hypothetical protein
MVRAILAATPYWVPLHCPQAVGLLNHVPETSLFADVLCVPAAAGARKRPNMGLGGITPKQKLAMVA